ncbi:MAG: 50S ribosomal protein L21 [Candidatus Latescibacteria bacterium]|nr:50S ribosomal protein L21 [Candidatus Latescibacterota bacterium]
MYAVVKLAGFQFKVEKQQQIRVPRLDIPIGERINIPEVLLVSDNEKKVVGSPTVPNATVEAKVLSHGKGEKITVFKMKRRKNYRRKKGHRQHYTEILIEDIHLGEN